MKRTILLFAATLLICAGAGSAAAGELVSGSFGFNYYSYERVYLTTGISYQYPLREAMDLVLGAEFGVSTSERSTGGVEANFLIPIQAGLNFPFPGERLSYSFGAGLAPHLNYGADIEGVTLRMGPYVHGLARLQVHPVMSLFLRFEQNLLFGAPRWIYTGSKLALGISF
jgi:hypothetical protein